MSSTSWRFDFGLGDAAEGYAKVTPATVYNPSAGFGFAEGSAVAARDRREPEPLKQDLCIPAEAEFRVDVPDGSYQLSLLIGDWILPSHTTVKASPGRLLINGLRTSPGQFVRETVSVRARGGYIRLQFSGQAPRINALEINAAPHALSLFLAGDSTVTDQPEDGYPYAGWGQMLASMLKHDVIIANEAASGRSSKSFIEEGRLDVIWNEIKPNDFLFIQFGHNDQKPDEERHTEPSTTYKEYLRRYIDGARERGAHPVLVTSVHRRFFAEDGTLQNTHGSYLDAVRELAEETGTPLIDLAARTKTLLEELGPEDSKQLFMWGARGEFANFPGGIEDNTHFQEQGAIRIAGLVVEEIRRIGLWPLAMYIR
ncbi:rhamnogalacturonan acetylesterase [Cohnella thailandensis]|uniref:Rhamnogalacturonan acetylesterase n=1 Tax=Cohnella thailandensis TaxID=557557 RepID=A0A841SUS1_9BACL|nr:rhamnogalacturonan acetylesterase [Cohnella thailandensis]MBB6635654.1 rhamnogalacturonan acetylesterase [Cohnella thailandensis]MBP1976031.1 lysophospholipase L1-like esterase [Cohnella thailandensis]